MSSWGFAFWASALLHPGGVATVELATTPRAVAILELEATADGPITVEARSLALDVKIAVFENDGMTPVAQDDNGLGGTDAAAVVPGRAGVRYRIEIRPADESEDTRGPVDVAVKAGARAELGEDERKPADDAYWERVGAGGEVALRVRALSGRGTLAYARGEYAKMAADYGAAVELATGAWGRTDGRTGVLLVTLGLGRYMSGDFLAAREKIDEGLPAIEARYGPDDPRTATAYNLRGVVEEDLGELRRARDAYERALAIRERLNGPDDATIVPSLSNLAGLLDRLGDPEGALPLFQRALSIVERKEPGSPRLASMLNNVAFALKRSGRVREALPLYEKAVALREQRLGPDHPSTATAIQNLGVALHELGDDAKALPLLERALAIRETRLGPSHPDVAVTLGNLALALRDLGRNERALELSDRQIAIRKEKLGASHPNVAEAQVSRARILANLGRKAEAIDEALGAEARLRASDRRVTRFLPDAQAMAFVAQRNSGVDVALTVAEAGGLPQATVARIWESALRSRALVLDEMARRSAAYRAAESATARDARVGLERAVAAWSRLVSGSSGVKADELPTALARAESALDAAERAFAEASPAFSREVGSRDATLEAIRAALPRDAALVSFVRYERSYAAFVLPPAGAASLVTLGDAADIDRLVDRWRTDVGTRAAEAEARRSGTALRERIWDRVAASAEGAARIVVVPDAALHLVPLAALPDGASGYVVESAPTIQYVATERDLLAPRASGSAGSILAIGGPAFDGVPTTEPPAGVRGETPSCEGFRALRFAPLPDAAREAEEIAKLVGGRSRVLTAAAASETAFKTMAPASGAVHLATHGFVVSERCAGEAPLQLSGLALAGANRRGTRPKGDDGILMAEEIARLDLSRAGWVALSACETGAGTAAPGEGILGLRRAFTIAGARTLVLALWSVDDRDARKWMKEAYRGRFGENAPAAEAARAASLSLLRERRARGLDTHPIHWGAFVVTGP